jgi:hypothetical protein
VLSDKRESQSSCGTVIALLFLEKIVVPRHESSICCKRRKNMPANPAKTLLSPDNHSLLMIDH